jgi:aspartate 1-decarboxylase
MCKSKLHRVVVTKTNLNYEGSIGIDESLASAAGILESEIVQVLNLENGERFTTHVILEPRDSGEICLYGPAARKGEVGDLLIIVSWGLFTEEELKNLKSKVICVDSKNRIIKK